MTTYVIQGRYSNFYGWEDLDEYQDDPQEAYRILNEYRIASPTHPHRIIERKSES